MDPLATGMLPICLGEATKFSGFLLDADKRYRVRIKLGVTTTTGDAEGEIVKTTPVSITESSVGKALHLFRGSLSQIPPMYSALKVNGRPLYKFARSGITIDRKPRDIVIHQLNLLDFHENELDLDVHCSKGTYIRTLAEDIGNALGCGGHVTSLHRIAVGHFQNELMVSLDELKRIKDIALEELDKLLLPMESLFTYPEILLTKETAFHLMCGKVVTVPQVYPPGQVRLFSLEKKFLGIGNLHDDGRVSPKRLVQQSDLRSE